MKNFFIGCAFFLFGRVFVSSPLPAGELNYYYLEAEDYQQKNGIIDFRDEGFTAWMGHPSGSRTVVFMSPGNTNSHTEYALNNLKDGEYVIFVRHLAWAKPEGKLDVLVNERSLGVTDFEKPGTCLAWSKKLGPFKKEGEASLTLKPAEGNQSHFYLDIILITNDLNYVPDNTDQDFKSGSKKDLGVDITTATLLGAGEVCQLKIKIRAEQDIYSPCVISAVCTEQGQYLATRFEKANVIKKGENEIVLDCPGLKQMDYSLRVKVTQPPDVLVAEKKLSITADDFSLTLVPDQYFYLKNDTKGTVKITINDPEIVRYAKYLNFAITGPGWKSNVVTIPRETFTGAYDFDLTNLTPGEYKMNIEVADQNKAGLLKTYYRFVKTTVEASRELLEDIRQVSIKDNTLFVNGKPFVPRQLYHAPEFMATKTQGFNAVDCWGGDTLDGVVEGLDLAHANNLYGYAVLFHPFFLKGKGKEKGWDKEALTAGINRLKNHPALLVWNLCDEPDTGIPVELVVEAYSLIKELDPNHPIFLNFCVPDKFREYSVAADVVGMDIYPVPSQPVTTVSDYMDYLAAAVDFKKPLSVALQTFSFPNFRMPTPEELKCMTYLAINHGAKLLGFYSYTENPLPGTVYYPHCLAGDRFLWSYTRCLNTELSSLSDVIAAPSASREIPGLDPSIDISVREVDKRLYVIAVNKSEQEVKTTQINIENCTHSKRVEVLFETRKVIFEEDGKTGIILTDTFKPLEVHIYKIQ